jgi:ATP-dependent helicase/DNAse subunit B
MKDSLLVIYPTALKVREQLVRLSRGSALLGHRLTTLPQVVEALWLESNNQCTALDEIGERLIIREVMTQVRTGGQSGQGSIERYVSLIQHLKAASINPDEWRGAVENLAVEERVRLADFTETFAAYQHCLSKRRLADQHDREAAALALLLRCESSGETPHFLNGVERLLIAEIYDLSLLQFMIVAALIRLVGDAELTIQAEPYKVGVSRFAELTWNRFVGEESIADKVLPGFVRREGRSGQLGFILEQIFTGNYLDAPARDASVKIVEAANPRTEAEQAARMVRRLLEEDSSVALDRIGIIARDFDDYARYLESAFRRYRIPLAIQAKKPLRASMPARILLDLLRIPLNGYRCDAIAALCDAPLIEVRVAEFRSLPAEAGYVDRATRPLKECLEKRRRELSEIGAQRGDKESPNVASRESYFDRGAQAWSDLIEGFETLEADACLQEHLENVRSLLERLHFDPLSGSLTDPAAKAGAALWRMLDELAAGAAAVMPERHISLAEFVEIIEVALASISAEIERSDRGAVRGLSVMDARGLDFEWMFILGLSDGKFPRYAPEDPMTPDRILPELNRGLREQIRRRFGTNAPDAPGPILRSSSARNSEEPFLFFLGLSMPTRGVVLSRACEDERGKPLARSPFLEEVMRLLGLQDDGAAPEPERWQETFIARDFLVAAAREEMDEKWITAAGIEGERAASIARRRMIHRARENYLAMPNREELFKQRLRADENKGRWLAVSRALEADGPKYATAGVYDGHVGAKPELRRLLLEGAEGERAWSATQLTELASCGFRFFARRVMLLNDTDEPDYEPSKSEAGNWAHQILHDLIKANPDFADLAVARKVAREIMARTQAEARDSARDWSFFEAHWESVVKVVEEAVLYEFRRHQADDRPDEFQLEHPFGLYLEGQSEAGETLRIRLEGRIDRLEIYRDAAGRIAKLRVIDYKHSSGRKRLQKLLKPEEFAVADLQMAAYLMGAVEGLQGQFAPEVVAEASYIALRDRGKETPPREVPIAMLESDEGPSRSEPGTWRMKDRIIGLVNQALAGRFDIDPQECMNWCPYRRICRFDSSLA